MRRARLREAGRNDVGAAGRDLELLLTLPERPRLFYGWTMLVGLSVAETISWGVLYYAFPVLIRPMEIELGWSRAQVTGAFSVALLVSGLAALPVGHWLDVRGARSLMAWGSGLGAVLLWGWSRVESIAALYLLWAGLGAVMASVLYEPAFAVIARWFVRRRHQALTVLTIFGAFASAVFVPLTSWLLHRQGWRGAIETLAVVLAFTTVPLHGLLLRRDPRDVGTGPDGDPLPAAANGLAVAPGSTLRSSLGGRWFRGLTIVFTLTSLATVGTGVHLVPYLTERGVSDATVAACVGSIGLMQIPGRALYGLVRRWSSLGRSMAVVLLLQAGAVSALPWARDPAGLMAFAVVFGMANGLATLFRASAVVEVFGPKQYGRLSGVLSFFTTGARAVGPMAAALAYQAAGSYGLVFPGFSAVLAVAAVSSLLLLSRPSR